MSNADWQGHYASDEALLRLLAGQGDRTDAVRQVDIRFKGEEARLNDLRQALKGEWRVVQLVAFEDSERWALDLVRDQKTDAASIRALTDTALTLEERFGVEYDGWGCVAQV